MSLLYKKSRGVPMAQKGKVVMTSNGPTSVYTPEMEAEAEQKALEAEYSAYASSAQYPDYVDPRPAATITQTPKPQGAMSKMYDGLVNPMTALSYATDPRKGTRPDHLNRLIKQGAVDRNNLDIAVDTFNPFSLADFISGFGSSTRDGDYLTDGMRAVSAIPMVRGAAGLLRPGSKFISNVARSNVARSARLDREVAIAGKEGLHRDAVIKRAKLIKKAQKSGSAVQPADFKYIVKGSDGDAIANLPKNTSAGNIYKARVGNKLSDVSTQNIKNIDNINMIAVLDDVDTRGLGKALGSGPLNSQIKRVIRGEKNTLKELDTRIAELTTDKGFKRLYRQELSYLKNNDRKYSDIAETAKQNTYFRIAELKEMKKTSSPILDVMKKAKSNGGAMDPDGIGTVQRMMKDRYMYDNAYFKKSNSLYRSYKEYKEALKGLITGGRDGKKRFLNASDNFGKVFSGNTLNPGKIRIGSSFAADGATVVHEIAHATQNGRQMPIDTKLLSGNWAKNLARDIDKEAVRYINKKRPAVFGSDVALEPSAFLAEARRSMLDKGFVTKSNGYFNTITPSDVSKAKEYFRLNPSIHVLPNNMISSTRGLDIMGTDKKSYTRMARRFNELPSIVPAAIVSGVLAKLLNRN